MSAVAQSPAVLNPLETIEFWRDAYSNPESGEHFLGHGMVVCLLSEYLEFRKQGALVPIPVPLVDLIETMEMALAALKRVRRVDAQHSQAEVALEAQISALKSALSTQV